MIIFISGVHSFLVQYSCSVMHTAHCDNFAIKHVCGTDGHTYRNW